MPAYEIQFHEDASGQLLALDKPVRERLIRRIARMGNEPAGRHLRHGMGFFVEESGQYRIVYTCDCGVKSIYFVGSHKDYEKWYSGK